MADKAPKFNLFPVYGIFADFLFKSQYLLNGLKVFTKFGNNTYFFNAQS